MKIVGLICKVRKSHSLSYLIFPQLLLLLRLLRSAKVIFEFLLPAFDRIHAVTWLVLTSA